MLEEEHDDSTNSGATPDEDVVEALVSMAASLRLVVDRLSLLVAVVLVLSNVEHIK